MRYPCFRWLVFTYVFADSRNVGHHNQLFKFFPNTLLTTQVMFEICNKKRKDSDVCAYISICLCIHIYRDRHACFHVVSEGDIIEKNVCHILFYFNSDRSSVVS